MHFNMNEAIEVLERTPQTLENFLIGLSEGWLHCNEGEGTWNAIEVIEHLIEGEKNNWIPRLEFILQEGCNRPFPPFDRYAHLIDKHQTSIDQKLLEFKQIRMQNISKLKSINVNYIMYTFARFRMYTFDFNIFCFPPIQLGMGGSVFQKGVIPN